MLLGQETIKRPNRSFNLYYLDPNEYNLISIETLLITNTSKF